MGFSSGEIWLNDKFYVVSKITSYNPKDTQNDWSNLHGKLADENFKNQCLTRCRHSD